jgi:hypothetical protein
MFIMGDIHGQYEKLVVLLRREELIDSELNWSGETNQLYFLGDYFDRGPDGIAVIELIMSLQWQASEVGGRVGALLGNHDVLTLAAYEFSEQPSGGPGGTFRDSWRLNGGNEADLVRLTDRHVRWIKSLPAMALVGNHLLAHADATFYQVYGRTIPAVNRAIQTILRSDDTQAWDHLLDYFSQRRAFRDEEMGQTRVSRFMGIYGGERFIHGHTPICKLTGQKPQEVVSPLVYAGGLAVDVDPGMYLGGPGFLFNQPV